MYMQAWQDFIQASAKSPHQVVVDGKIVRFDEQTLELEACVNDTIICDLSHLGLLELSGADVMAFIQGQVTNDVHLLNGSNAHYSAYCSPKGRMLALFLAFQHHDHLHLQLPIELTESIAKRLRMYVMRSKVVIEDYSERIIKIGISGSNAVTMLQTLFAKVPEVDLGLTTNDNGTILKLSGIKPRFEIFTDLDHAKLLWDKLKTQARPVGVGCWEWLEIQAGIPEVVAKTQDAFVPQMLNLDALNAINYKKGCYTGQEIVARTHYLGKIKRRTQLAWIATNSPPQIGDDVVDSKQQAVGMIVRVAKAREDGFDVLAECRLDNLLENNLYWQGITLHIKPLPYPLDT